MIVVLACAALVSLTRGYAKCWPLLSNCLGRIKAMFNYLTQSGRCSRLSPSADSSTLFWILSARCLARMTLVAVGRCAYDDLSSIEDIETDAGYAPYRATARAAGYRAVVSAPILGGDGRPLGIISTHFTATHRPTEHEMRRLSLCVRQAADFIQRCKTEKALRQSEGRLRELSDRVDSEVKARTERTGRAK